MAQTSEFSDEGEGCVRKTKAIIIWFRRVTEDTITSKQCIGAEEQKAVFSFPFNRVVVNLNAHGANNKVHSLLELSTERFCLSQPIPVQRIEPHALQKLKIVCKVAESNR